MKVIVTESKLGIEYLADVISSCNQNGVECIVDDNAGEILYYLPKEGRYGDDKLLQNSDESIFDLVQDKERLVSVLKDAKGDEFKEFAVKWNGLQTKGEEDEVYKTDHCNPIRGNFAESPSSGKKPKVVGTRKPSKDFMDRVEKFRSRWKSLDGDDDLDDDGLTQADRDHLERLKRTRDDFGDRVNGIEAQVSEGQRGRVLGAKGWR